MATNNERRRMKSQTEENVSLVLACRYFIEESPRITDLRPGDELLKVSRVDGD